MDAQLALGARPAPSTSSRRASRRRRSSRCEAALAASSGSSARHARRARRRLHDRRRRLRRRDVLPRGRLGRGADDARRPGRRGDRRQDRDRPPGREEPRRRVPLAGADGDRPATARDAAAGASAANGRAEVVKTGLLAGEPLWELPLAEQVRRAAAFKAALCLRDPHDRGDRAQLNLGHTFAHALEAAADYDAAARHAPSRSACSPRCGSPASTTDAVEESSGRSRCGSTASAAWAALARDKKASAGAPRLVLLEAPGAPARRRRGRRRGRACAPRSSA